MLLVVAREQRGWTQRELSDHSGVSKSRVHRMETGYWDKSPVADVQAVCTALELAPEALIAPQHQVQSRWQGRMGAVAVANELAAAP